jgi:dTDP-glucose 4,6-dehydratase
MDDTPKELRQNIRIVPGDLRDTECVRRLIRSGDTVFHLAALIGIPYSYEAPRSYVDTNITGTLNVLEAARQAGAQKVLVVSTSEVYGTALRVPIDEDHPLQAQSPYSATKIAAEKIAESFYRSFEQPVTIVRPFNTFGPRQSARAVIPTILMQLLGGANELRLGDPTTTRDFSYVADTVEGMIRLASCYAATGRVVNIGTGHDVSIQHVADVAQQLIGHRAAIRTDADRVRPAASEVRRLCADNRLLKKLTGWVPPSRLEEGLQLTIEWMRHEMHRYDPEKYYV